eukprot:8931798-Heterocapsa_arctica.AAC.1
MIPVGPLWLDSRTSAMESVLMEGSMTDELENMESFTVIRKVPEEKRKEKEKKAINYGWVTSERGPDRVKFCIMAQKFNKGDWADAF